MSYTLVYLIRFMLATELKHEDSILGLRPCSVQDLFISDLLRETRG